MLLNLLIPTAGLQNPEEFSFTSDEETLEQSLRRQGHRARDQKKLDTLKKKLHTDDECMFVWFMCSATGSVDTVGGLVLVVLEDTHPFPKAWLSCLIRS